MHMWRLSPWSTSPSTPVPAHDLLTRQRRSRASAAQGCGVPPSWRASGTTGAATLRQTRLAVGVIAPPRKTERPRAQGRPAPLEPRRERAPVERGHPAVGQDHRIRPLVALGEDLTAMAGYRHRVARMTQEPGAPTDKAGCIVDHQHGPRRARSHAPPLRHRLLRPTSPPVLRTRQRP